MEWKINKMQQNNKVASKKAGYILQVLFFTMLFMTASVRSAFSATSSIIIDAETGNVLSASAADTLRYPASLTKLMTLYITFNALEKGFIKMDDKLPVSRKAANRSPSKLGLKPGEKITVKDAVLALVVKSANDCASVLAEGLGYSEENFAKTMTEVAHELGMKNTTFRNASGLPNREQKTTARDMAILGAAIYHHFPKYYKLFATPKFTYKGRTYYSHNHILKSFEGADGMKTGFTNAAGYNIVTSAERNGKRVIAVTMGHNTAKARDQKVSSLMKQALKKLENEKPALYASNTGGSNISVPADASENKTVIEEIAQTEDINNWGIQIGAFSNYAKARNYALNIRKQIKVNSGKKEIDIEPYQKGAAIIYRSKIVGFEKKEAAKACDSLKKTNKSCIVVATGKNEITVASKL